jgi:signal peptidase II
MATVTLLVTAVALLIVDQATKALVLARLHTNTGVSCGGVTLRRVINRRGGGFGRAYVALWMIELALLIALVQLVPAFVGTATHAALGAAFGGASGNLLDRLWRGGVVDFIDVGFWPVFNVADIAIVVGTITAASALL